MTPKKNVKAIITSTKNIVIYELSKRFGIIPLKEISKLQEYIERELNDNKKTMQVLFLESLTAW